MVLYVNGCSHSAGHCIRLQKTYSNIVMSSLCIDTPHVINPTLPNKNLPINFLYNESCSGAGNDYIFHKTIETLSYLISIDRKPNYVIIQWSGANRRMHCNEKGVIEFVNPWDMTELGVPFEPMASLHSLHFIFTLQEFLKSKEIEYCFFNYMGLHKTIKKSNILPLIDFDKWIDFGNGDYLFEGLINFFKLQNLCCDELGHPNQEANFIIANKITDKLKINMIDKDIFLVNKFI
tara:strand:+ start:277 stop:981 length:705 start_codon:yes stop_codon:yes gene_type:complete